MGKEKEEIGQRFTCWEISRGSYIMPKKYIRELRAYLFTGKSATLESEGQWQEYPSAQHDVREGD